LKIEKKSKNVDLDKDEYSCMQLILIILLLLESMLIISLFQISNRIKTWL
jgi:hypothetical protein